MHISGGAVAVAATRRPCHGHSHSREGVRQRGREDVKRKAKSVGKIEITIKSFYLGRRASVASISSSAQSRTMYYRVEEKK